MAKVDGGYMLISSLFAALLAFGIAPSQAMGYSSIFCIPLMLSVLDLVTADEVFGLRKNTWKVILIAFVGASAYGMLA
jgi:undecaprenyl pyrophosphate phosphatase UppP